MAHWREIFVGNHQSVQIQVNSKFTLSKKVCKEHNIVYDTDTVDQAENIAFTSSPVLSEKFSLHRKSNYEHQILFDKKMSFRTRVAAQNLTRVGLTSLNRLT